MKKFKWLLGMLVLALMPMLQSCDDDDGYSIGDFSWDWATVRTTGGGGYYLVGDRWGIIDPVATSIPWFKPVEGERRPAAGPAGRGLRRRHPEGQCRKHPVSLSGGCCGRQHRGGVP